MNLTAFLTGSHLRTYDTLFQHPVSHNLAWHDVHALFRHIGAVSVEANSNLKVTRNGHVLILHPQRTKDVAEADEILALRRFIEQSNAAPPVAPGPDAQWVVVIDHREARIYRSAAAHAAAQVIRPHAPEDFFRHAPNSKQISRGQEKPEPNSYFEPVAAILNGAGKILVLGNGTGTGSEMEQFTAWLAAHRPEVARRVVGSLTVDLHHQTEGQLLAKAREFYASQVAV